MLDTTTILTATITITLATTVVVLMLGAVGICANSLALQTRLTTWLEIGCIMVTLAVALALAWLSYGPIMLGLFAGEATTVGGSLSRVTMGIG